MLINNYDVLIGAYPLTLSYQLSENPVSSTSHTSLEFQSYVSTLKAIYRDPNLFKKASGPKFKELEFINLALVKKQSMTKKDKIENDFLKNSIHGLAEDITKKKEEIEISNIFNYDNHGQRRLILVEGSPGVGKTMLALKLCKDWAEGKVLLEYDLVILLQLRLFQTQHPLEVKDLLKIHCGGQLAESMECFLFMNCGKKTLLIFEGWDELHPCYRKEGSIFLDIISPNKLPMASVMVSSRPTATDTLLTSYMDERHIEVLGFQPNQITQYVEHNFMEKSNLILKHLKNFPNLKALAHIPLTLSIICEVVEKEQLLPSTLTELYNRYICQVLFKAIQRQGSASMRGLSDISELPDDIKTELYELCKVALCGLKDRKCIFTSSDLTFSILNSGDGRGLLNIIPVLARAGETNLYQFTHLSIQEFLAALQIQLLPTQECIQLLREYREDKQFQNVWKFLSGRTRLQDKELWNTILSTTKQANISQLFLMHCLYEAHDERMCQVAAAELKWMLNLNNMNLNRTDCLCAAYTIVSAEGPWIVDLRSCNIGADGLEIFKQHFLDKHYERKEFRIKKFE